jgi:phosphotransferase system HPr (HPr) family protein
MRGAMKMPEGLMVIHHSSGLHARPAADFVQLAQRFTCDINIEVDGRIGNAKSILNVLSMGILQGTQIKLHAEGEDADQALQELLSWNEQINLTES